jgi:3-methyl-2-oxobutanoate hydroxymethyltransferase
MIGATRVRVTQKRKRERREPPAPRAGRIANGSASVTAGRERWTAQKRAGRPIVMVTCYDYPTAVIEDEAGVDIVFVGDSVGTNVLGYESETEVTMEDMLHHLRAVRRGVRHAYLLADLPSGAYDTPSMALDNARRLLDAGADGVKLEGGRDQVPVVAALIDAGIDVCGHIGYTPQTLSRPGGRGRVQGKSFERAMTLVRDADELDRAGVMLLVLELVTEEVARVISRRIVTPTVGIGAGRYCDGQVLVVPDLLGLSPITHRLARRYANWRETGSAAMRQFVNEVRSHVFPGEENVFPADPDELARLESELSVTR